MTDNHPEVASVLIGDKERKLKIGPAAFRLASIKYDINVSTEELSNPSMALLAQLAWIGCLPDEPDLKEEEFVILMANSNEREILSAVGRSLARMTEGLSALDASGEKKGKGRGKK